VRVPAMEEIQSHLAYISCVKNLEGILRSGCCEYIRPPIDKFQTLQFNAFDEIMDCGYNFARPYFQAMIQTEKLRVVLRPTDKITNRLSTGKLIPETSSLTDLANMMSSADMSDITEPITVFDITHALGTYNDEETEETAESQDSAESEAPEFYASDDE